MNKSTRKFFLVLCVLSLVVSSVPDAPSVLLPKNLAAKSFVGKSNANKQEASYSRRSFFGISFKALLVSFLPVWLQGCVKGGSGSGTGFPVPPGFGPPTGPATPQLSIEDHANWLVSQIQKATDKINSAATPQTNLIGLIKSYESNNDSYAHVYDQAKAAMALLVADYQVPGKGYRQKAETLLTTLAANQNVDGSFPAAFHLTDPIQNLTGKQTGAIAFVGLAVNLYTLKTENTQFVAMGKKSADYFVDNAITRPVFPGKAVPNEDRAALSGEENLAVYAFLEEFVVLSFDQDYIETALAIRQFLESLWNNDQGCFYRGRNSGVDDSDVAIIDGDYAILDTTPYTADVQFALLALGNTSENGLFNFYRAIDPDPAQVNSVKAVLETTNTSKPNGIAFDYFVRYNTFPGQMGQNWDAAQTNRYATALLTYANRLGPNVSAPVANQQRVNAEALAIIAPDTGFGSNPATGISGTHGGVIRTLFPGSDQLLLGPSVEATTEAIFAKAKLGGFNGVNFYLASEAITQFASLEQSLKKDVLEILYPQSAAETFLRYYYLLEKPLGSITEKRVEINGNHLSQVWNTLKSALPFEKLSSLIAETYGDFILAVIHHEAIVHANLSEMLEQGAQKEEAISNFMSSHSELLSRFATRYMVDFTHEGSYLDSVEEFLAQLISYVTYPKGATLTSFIEDPEIQKLLKLLPGSESDPVQKLVAQVKAFFPTIAPLFEYTVHNETLTERKLQVEKQLQALNGRVHFDNKEELLSLVQPLLFEVAL